MAKNPDGTTIKTDPTPDSELRKGADPSEYDSNFDFLGGKKDGNTDGDENKPAEGSEEEKAAKAIEDAKAKEAEESKAKETDELDEVVEKVIGKKKEEVIVKPTDEVAKLTTDYESKITTLNQQLTDEKAKSEKFGNIAVVIEQLQRDPYSFVKQYLPELAPHLDPTKPLRAQLKKEFGDEFKFDAGEAYEEGTPSYKYRLREEELRDEQRRASLQKEAQLIQERQQGEGLVRDAKVKVMKRYNLTEEQYQKEIVDYFKNFRFTPEHLAMIRYRNTDVEVAIRKAIEKLRQRSKSTDRPDIDMMDLRGEEDKDVVASEGYKELLDVFGD